MATPEEEQDGGSATWPRVGVAVPAAGSGQRMGGLKKQYLELAGEPVLARALRPFLDHPGVECIAVALPREDTEDPPEWLVELSPRVTVASGGDSRRDSVAAAVRALPDDVEVVLVHDGARPLVTRDVIDECIRVAAGGSGAVAGYPAADTIKTVDEEGVIVDTPDRARLWHAQTPQAFPRPLLVAAYERAMDQDLPATDDAALVEMVGGTVEMVTSSPTNLKVTRPEDLEVAEVLLRRRGRP